MTVAVIIIDLVEPATHHSQDAGRVRPIIECDLCFQQFKVTVENVESLFPERVECVFFILALFTILALRL